jgi:hypothetical protein
MIKASEVIMRQDVDMKNAIGIINNLERQLHELMEQYETLRNSSTTTTPGGTTG